MCVPLTQAPSWKCEWSIDVVRNVEATFAPLLLQKSLVVKALTVSKNKKWIAGTTTDGKLFSISIANPDIQTFKTASYTFNRFDSENDEVFAGYEEQRVVEFRFDNLSEIRSWSSNEVVAGCFRVGRSLIGSVKGNEVVYANDWANQTDKVLFCHQEKLTDPGKAPQSGIAYFAADRIPATNQILASGSHCIHGTFFKYVSIVDPVSKSLVFERKGAEKGVIRFKDIVWSVGGNYLCLLNQSLRPVVINTVSGREMLLSASDPSDVSGSCFSLSGYQYFLPDHKAGLLRVFGTTNGDLQYQLKLPSLRKVFPYSNDTVLVVSDKGEIGLLRFSPPANRLSAWLDAPLERASVEILRGIVCPDLSNFNSLVSELDSEKHSVREKARVRLREFGPAASQALEAAQQESSPEVQASIRAVLRSIRSPTDAKRSFDSWIIEFLVSGRSSQARELLTEISKLDSLSELSKEALIGILVLDRYRSERNRNEP
jgi:hypothetical protein